MSRVELVIGTKRTLNSGQVDDSLVPVVFQGERLARRTSYDGDSDTRGTTETLYRTEDGRRVVHVEEWTRWQGEPSVYTLVEVEEEDLLAGGRFEALGLEARLVSALTLDEALERCAA
jgi:hypothetical protein